MKTLRICIRFIPCYFLGLYFFFGSKMSFYICILNVETSTLILCPATLYNSQSSWIHIINDHVVCSNSNCMSPSNLTVSHAHLV